MGQQGEMVMSIIDYLRNFNSTEAGQRRRNFIENMFDFALPELYSNLLVFSLPILVIEDPDTAFAVPR